MIVYTPFWETLEKRGITTYDLIYKRKVSSYTIHRLRHNEGISTSLMNELCKMLNCRVEDIALYVPDEDN